MAGRSEIMAALAATLVLARGDQAGYRLFNNTMDGFWRSFGAIMLIAPMTVITTMAEIEVRIELGAGEDGSDTGLHLMRLAALSVDWIAYPAIMVPLALVLRLGERYAPYIIACNWSSVPIMAALVCPWAAYLVGVIGAEFALMLNLAAMAWAVWFRFWIARTALGTGIVTSGGLVVLEILLSLTINSAGEALMG